MAQYLLSIYQPAGTSPPAEALQRIMREVAALREEMKAAGAWVFNAGLQPPSAARVLRLEDGAVLTTDGPFVESKEHLGGFTVVSAPDLEAALAWGRKLARALSVDGRSSLAVEVREFRTTDDHG